MQHSDDETLGLLALGEPGTDEVTTHVAGCAWCRHQVESLRGVMAAVRLLGDAYAVPIDVRRVPPPVHVWNRIASATGVGLAPRAEVVARDPARTTPPVVPTRPRRRTRRGRAILVAAGWLVLGLVAGAAGARLIGDAGSDGTQVVAATTLTGLAPAPDASGTADVVRAGDARTLDLDISRLATANGFYEVWLIDPTVTKMVPVGILSGSTGRFSLPAGVDLAAYPIVDVSAEPMDGNPGHSGRSVLRGTLRS